MPPDLPPSSACATSSCRCFLNLVLNAIDATTKGGQIDHCSRMQRPAASSSTSHDDGQGIAPDQRARLFQPYFTTKKHGTGLGLFVTRKLVADHGGDMSTFVIEPGGRHDFPRAPAQARDSCRQIQPDRPVVE